MVVAGEGFLEVSSAQARRRCHWLPALVWHAGARAAFWAQTRVLLALLTNSLLINGNL